jgi:hypothetical protein
MPIYNTPGTIIGTNKATTPQVPSEKICFEALTTLNKTCGDGAVR